MLIFIMLIFIMLIFIMLIFIMLIFISDYLIYMRAFNESHALTGTTKYESC